MDDGSIAWGYSPDGTWSEQYGATYYSYDDYGRMTAASGWSWSESDSTWSDVDWNKGAYSESFTSQEYTIYRGQARLTKSSSGARGRTPAIPWTPSARTRTGTPR
jgi:hypothetical protein